MKIVFAGTPDISKSILNDILDEGYQIDLVLTQPDRPAGRGKKVVPSPVKQLALEKHLNILQPSSLKNNLEIINQLKAIKPDIIIVFAYGMILPKVILDIPTLGCVNIHVSLLPNWRGAAPIQRAIIAGDATTGVTLMKMDEGLDTGDILIQEEVKIENSDTALSLSNKLTAIGSKLILQYLKNSQQITPRQQPQIGISYAHKIDKAEARINWDEDASLITRKIRGFNPSPGCFTTLDDQLIKIWHAEVTDFSHKLEPGFIALENKNLYVGCAGGTTLIIKELQPAGKNRQNVEQYLNGSPQIINKKFI